ncbi:class I SAM-dependent methyltransferase [Endozoicomonadaceae bacterium StTr2]
MGDIVSSKELDDIIQWDIKNWSPALEFWSSSFDIRPGMRVLAIGEREGGLSVYFAKKGCDVVCSDYRDFPEGTKKLHARYNINPEYCKVDIMDIPFSDGEFDVVVFKSVISLLGTKENQDLAIKEVVRVLKPGGALLFAENSKASFLHSYLRNKFNAWSENCRYIDQQDIKDWSKFFSCYFKKTNGVFGLLGRTESQREKLALLDKLLVPIIPKRWHYIYFGVFIK